MKAEKILKFGHKVIMVLFPDMRAYFNFFLMWVFLLVMVSHAPEHPLTVLISSIGVIYCFNEWVKGKQE